MKIQKAKFVRMVNVSKNCQKISPKSGLPKEMPIERDVYFLSPYEAYERAKAKIQISIDNMLH